jgi:lipopolysaccharide transport system permease protein
LSQASECLIQNESIIRKVYFPKILLPISSVLASLIDVGINIVLLIIAAYIFGFLPSVWTIFLFPAAIILISLTSIGMGLFLSSINIRFRDVRYILPFFIQLTLFLTPVVYPLTIVSQRNKYIMAINPLTTAIELVRQSFSVSPQIDARMIAVSCISVLFFLLTGIWVFYKTERFFADIV